MIRSNSEWRGFIRELNIVITVYLHPKIFIRDLLVRYEIVFHKLNGPEISRTGCAKSRRNANLII